MRPRISLDFRCFPIQGQVANSPKVSFCRKGKQWFSGVSGPMYGFLRTCWLSDAERFALNLCLSGGKRFKGRGMVSSLNS